MKVRIFTFSTESVKEIKSTEKEMGEFLEGASKIVTSQSTNTVSYKTIITVIRD